MVTLHQTIILGEIWWVARMGDSDVLRNRTRTGCVLDCWTLGLVVVGGAS